jgi:hypothetical protein
MEKFDAHLTLEKGIGFALLIPGLSIFWYAAAFGMRHLIPNGLIGGIVITLAILFAGFGFLLLRLEKNSNPGAMLDSLLLFLSVNLFLFEISLYFNPYPNYWWTRQATDWIAMLGLGNMITNELVFAVSFLFLSVRIALFILKRIS